MLAAGGLALLVGCGSLFPAKYRFRMTVEVDTPEGLRTGSSVMEVTSRVQNLPGKGLTPSTHLTGEAVAVDLSGGQTLFALIGPGGGGLAQEVTSLFGPGVAGTAKSFVAHVEKLGRRSERGRVVVAPPDKYPQLVTFGDKSDPKSVEAVDPANLAASFGPGVALRRVTVSITDDAVTTGIEGRLKWLPNYYGRLFNGERYEGISSDLAGHLGAGNFSTELSK